MRTRLHACAYMFARLYALICLDTTVFLHAYVLTCLLATPCSPTLTHIDNHLTPCDTYLITISGRTSSSGVRHTFRFLVLKDASKTSCGRRKKDQDGPRRPKNASKRSCGRRKTAQYGSKTPPRAQDGPKTPPRCLAAAARRIKTPQGGSKTPPRRLAAAARRPNKPEDASKEKTAQRLNRGYQLD